MRTGPSRSCSPGNAAVRDEVAAVLRAGGLPVHEADNVLPDIGRLAPESARAAIREVFLEHVIGGDRLSTDPRLRPGCGR